MKLYNRLQVYSHTFLTMALNGGEWSASCPGHFTITERDPSTHGIGGCMGPSASLHAVEERKILSLPGFEPLTSWASSPQPITILTELSQLLWHMMDGINCEMKILEQNLKVNETTIKHKSNWLPHSVTECQIKY
jgi:hypothetical protein